MASVTKNGFSLSWEVDEGKSLPGWSSRAAAGSAPSAAAAGQGLTFDHFSAQPKYHMWDMLGVFTEIQ